MTAVLETGISVLEAAPADTRTVRERLLAAALDQVQQHGMAGLRQERVAAAAGLRQSHLTYYFPTRKDLIKAIVQEIRDGVIAAMHAAVPAEGAGAESLAQVREFYAMRASQPLMARLILALMNAVDEDPSLRDWLNAFDTDMMAQTQAIFTRLGLQPTADEVALFFSTMVGLSTKSAQFGTEEAYARAAHLARCAVDRLVQASTPAPGAGQ